MRKLAFALACALAAIAVAMVWAYRAEYHDGVTDPQEMRPGEPVPMAMPDE